MKKLILTALALVALASTAMAQHTLNLGWAACRTAANTGNAAVNDVQAANFDCNNALAVRNLVAAVNAPAYTSFGGASVQLDIITGGGAAIPDWWDVGQKVADGNNCRAGGLIRGVIATLNSCANPYGAANQQGGEAYRVGDLGPGTMRFLADHVPVGGAPFVAPGTGGYAAMLLQITNANAIDPDFGDVFCAGCATPACLQLNGVDWLVDGVVTKIGTTGLRSYVTWYGGTGANCPGVIPTKNATWGQVKALYR